MAFFHNPRKKYEQTIARLRESFWLLTQDGTYPHERQHRLYQACQRIGLDWNQARQELKPEAAQFLRARVRDALADGQLTAEEVQELQRLQRRLALDADDVPFMDRLYDAVERKLQAHIIDRAVYLGNERAVQSLLQQISRYQLPEDWERPLIERVLHQHHYGKLLAGVLPVITPTLTLAKDERCHLDIAATFVALGELARDVTAGRFLATSNRLFFVSPSHRFGLAWPDLTAVKLNPNAVHLMGRTGAGDLYCHDPQYVATLLIGASQRYCPRPLPPPIHPKRRLGEG